MKFVQPKKVNLIRKAAMCLILSVVVCAFGYQKNFLSEQTKYERVRTALKEKEGLVAKNLQDKGLTLNDLNIIMVAYKDEDELEIYAKKKNETTYTKLATYKICSRSGALGPKRKKGDNQVPEGFYHINRFNPSSNFYVSLGLNYPNQADKLKSSASDLGGDIFIHGSCVTIGCMPMTDDKMKEIYLYAIHAKSNGQTKIPVYVFPFKMTEQNFAVYKTKYNDNKILLAFWSNLKKGFDAFTKEKKELNFTIAPNGDYLY